MLAQRRIGSLIDQGGNRHRSDPTRHGCDQAGAGQRGIEVDIADVALVVAGIDDDRAFFDPVARDEVCPTDRGHDDIGAPHLIFYRARP